MARGTAATAVNVLAWWALLLVLYLVLISTVSALELMVGAGFALLGAVTAEAVRRAEHPRPRAGRRLAAAAAAFPGTLLRETGQLALAVLRTLLRRGDPGVLVTIRTAPEVDAALAAALLSASPGACVIDIRRAAAGPPEDGGPEPADEATPGTAKRGEAARTPAAGHDLTAHLLRPAASAVERALGGRRLT
jgi:multisubunit Na+/H+ antiporter MnhE subunit